ncbi:MAG: oligosaccharide flippase family protein [Armatimonadia bacterium]
MAAPSPTSAHRKITEMRVTTAVLIIGGSSYFSMLAGVLRSIIVMRLIGPHAQGIRRIVDIGIKYLFNAHLGILHGTNKAVSIYIGKGDESRVEEVEDVGITWTIGLTVIAAVGMAIYGLTNPTGDITKAVAIIIGAGWLLAQQTYTLYRTIIRAWGNFGALGIVGAIDTIATFALTILGAWKYGVLGAMAGTLAAWCISLLSLHLFAPLYIRPRFKPRVALRLALSGLPIAAVIFSDTLLRTIDGAIIGHYLGDYSMGLYSVAMQMAAYLFAIPESAGFVIWPRILQAYGAADRDPDELRRQIVMPTLVSAFFMPFIAGLAYVMLPPLVSGILPQFALSTGAAQTLAMASVFLALPMATNSLLIANNREFMAVVVKLIGAGVSGIGCLYFVRNHGTLEQLAAAASVGYALTAVASLAVVLPRYAQGFYQTAKLFIFALAPFVYACAVLYLSYLTASIFVAPSPGSWTWTITRVLVFTLLMIPLLSYGNRKTLLLTQLSLMYNSRRRKRGHHNETND